MLTKQRNDEMLRSGRKSSGGPATNDAPRTKERWWEPNASLNKDRERSSRSLAQSSSVTATAVDGQADRDAFRAIHIEMRRCKASTSPDGVPSVAAVDGVAVTEVRATPLISLLDLRSLYLSFCHDSCPKAARLMNGDLRRLIQRVQQLWDDTCADVTTTEADLLPRWMRTRFAGALQPRSSTQRQSLSRKRPNRRSRSGNGDSDSDDDFADELVDSDDGDEADGKRRRLSSARSSRDARNSRDSSSECGDDASFGSGDEVRSTKASFAAPTAADPTADELVGASKDVEVSDAQLAAERVFVLLGDVGSGKSAVVHSLARQIGFRVTELNAGTLRSSAVVKHVLLETAERAPLDHGEAEAALGLIVVDEADLLLEPEELTMHTALLRHASQARCPVLLTCETLPRALCGLVHGFSNIQRRVRASRGTLTSVIRRVGSQLAEEGLIEPCQGSWLSSVVANTLPLVTAGDMRLSGALLLQIMQGLVTGSATKTDVVNLCSPAKPSASQCAAVDDGDAAAGRLTAYLARQRHDFALFDALRPPSSGAEGLASAFSVFFRPTIVAVHPPALALGGNSGDDDAKVCLTIEGEHFLQRHPTQAEQPAEVLVWVGAERCRSELSLDGEIRVSISSGQLRAVGVGVHRVVVEVSHAALYSEHDGSVCRFLSPVFSLPATLCIFQENNDTAPAVRELVPRDLLRSLQSRTQSFLLFKAQGEAADPDDLEGNTQFQAKIPEEAVEDASEVVRADQQPNSAAHVDDNSNTDSGDVPFVEQVDETPSLFAAMHNDRLQKLRRGATTEDGASIFRFNAPFSQHDLAQEQLFWLERVGQAADAISDLDLLSVPQMRRHAISAEMEVSFETDTPGLRDVFSAFPDEREGVSGDAHYLSCQVIVALGDAVGNSLDKQGLLEPSDRLNTRWSFLSSATHIAEKRRRFREVIASNSSLQLLLTAQCTATATPCPLENEDLPGLSGFTGGERGMWKEIGPFLGILGAAAGEAEERSRGERMALSLAYRRASRSSSRPRIDECEDLHPHHNFNVGISYLRNILRLRSDRDAAEIQLMHWGLRRTTGWVNDGANGLVGGERVSAGQVDEGHGLRASSRISS
eukprot:gene14164-10116_t